MYYRYVVHYYLSETSVHTQKDQCCLCYWNSSLLSLFETPPYIFILYYCVLIPYPARLSTRSLLHLSNSVPFWPPSCQWWDRTGLLPLFLPLLSSLLSLFFSGRQTGHIPQGGPGALFWHVSVLHPSFIPQYLFSSPPVPPKPTLFSPSYCLCFLCLCMSCYLNPATVHRSWQ